MARSVSYDAYLIKSLKDRRMAEAYLNAALEQEDPRVFLLALRNVAQARGMSKLAARSKLKKNSSLPQGDWLVFGHKPSRPSVSPQTLTTTHSTAKTPAPLW
jgi:Probable addiction module antidote protein